MKANERLLPAGDGFIGKIQELGAAAAHLDGDIAQRAVFCLNSCTDIYNHFTMGMFSPRVA
jgi:hypothetical protein